MIDLNRSGDCEDLGIRIDCWSERTSTGYCYMLERWLMYRNTWCVLILDCYGTIGIMSWL